MGFGLLDLEGLMVHDDLTEQAQDIGLISTLLVIPREAEDTLSKFERILQAAGQQIRFTQTTEPHCLSALSALRGGLLQQWQSLDNSPGQGIRHTQGRG